MMQEIDHPVGDRIKQLGPGIKLSSTSARIRRPVPMLGEHTREILSELGYTQEGIEQLAAERVVSLGGMVSGEARQGSTS